MGTSSFLLLLTTTEGHLGSQPLCLGGFVDSEGHCSGPRGAGWGLASVHIPYMPGDSEPCISVTSSHLSPGNLVAGPAESLTQASMADVALVFVHFTFFLTIHTPLCPGLQRPDEELKGSHSLSGIPQKGGCSALCSAQGAHLSQTHSCWLVLGSLGQGEGLCSRQL